MKGQVEANGHFVDSKKAVQPIASAGLKEKKVKKYLVASARRAENGKQHESRRFDYLYVAICRMVCT